MNNKITIYVFGNSLLAQDSLPIKLLPKLKKQFREIEFIAMDPNENIKPKNKKLIIIDTVIGLKKVAIINNLNNIQLDKIYSCHDFDLGYNLKLLQKIGELKKVIIFGVPPGISGQKALKQLIKAIEKLLKN